MVSLKRLVVTILLTVWGLAGIVASVVLLQRGAPARLSGGLLIGGCMLLAGTWLRFLLDI